MQKTKETCDSHKYQRIQILTIQIWKLMALTESLQFFWPKSKKELKNKARNKKINNAKNKTKKWKKIKKTATYWATTA